MATTIEMIHELLATLSPAERLRLIHTVGLDAAREMGAGEDTHVTLWPTSCGKSVAVGDMDRERIKEHGTPERRSNEGAWWEAVEIAGDVRIQLRTDHFPIEQPATDKP